MLRALDKALLVKRIFMNNESASVALRKFRLQKHDKTGKGPLTVIRLIKLLQRFEETGSLEDRDLIAVGGSFEDRIFELRIFVLQVLQPRVVLGLTFQLVFFLLLCRKFLLYREVPLWHGGTLNCRRAASPLVRLVEGEERWKAPDQPQSVLPQNWVKPS
ncbi:hypothetical protein TNCV_1932571 [Trichonephila clavipes]|nr:hypothetical protein TNCV_1932571 [Trichonephila clavipes]